MIRMKKITFPLFIFVISILINSNNLSATYVKAVKIVKPPKIDGFLDDDVWKKIPPFTNFQTAEPVSGGKPTEKTELKVAYDDKNLYFGIMCYDSEANKISAGTMKTDSEKTNPHMERILRGGKDDLIRILLDTFGDRRSAYVFFVNPNGARSDGLAFGEKYSLNWDGIWEAKAKILKNGWSVEIKIPFKTLSFNPKLKEWGINVERYIPRKMEIIRVGGVKRNSIFYNPAEAVGLKGIHDVKQGLGITVKPYFRADTQKDYSLSLERENRLTGGFDIYKKFTPNFTGVFSYNTDSAEAEVDDRKINLTRFSILYPEKRSFFLEGSEIFRFGSALPRVFIPFFTRKIGLYEGRQIPILYGGKLFGKIGNTNIGLINIKTKAYEEIPSQSFTVFRLSQDILSQGKIGLIFTDGEPGEKTLNRLFGIDFSYQTSKFLKDKNLTTGLWFVYNKNKIEGNHKAFGFKLDYPNDLFYLTMNYSYFGDAFNPGLSFIPRTNVQNLRSGIEFRPRVDKGPFKNLIRQMFFQAYRWWYWTLDGKVLSKLDFFSPFNIMTESGEHIQFAIKHLYDTVLEDFEIIKGVTIPAALFDYIRYRFIFQSAMHRKVSVNSYYEYGDFYDGKLKDFDIGVELLFNEHLNLSSEIRIIRGYVSNGDINKNLLRLKLDLFYSPDLALLNYIQYDDVTKELGANIRLIWRRTPENIIYLVFNKNWVGEDLLERRFYPQWDNFIFKIVYNWRP